MKIKLNGKETEVKSEITISQLLEEISVPKAGTAVAINTEIIKRDEMENRIIRDGEEIEILRAIGGG